MPTGYTAAIADGIDFETFVMRCARGMGALIMMRDEPVDAPISERFEPSDYHTRKLTEANAELEKLHAMSLEETEAAAHEAFVGGWATPHHFDSLADMRNVLTLAANYRDDKSARVVCEAMRIPIGNMRQRYDATGRMGVTGDEMRMLGVFIDFYRDFWMRQPVALYDKACDEIGKFNGSFEVAA